MSATVFRGVIQRADEGVRLVEHRRRFVEQLAQEGRFLVAAGEPEDVVHPLGGFAVVDALGHVFGDFVFQLVDIVVERIAVTCFASLEKMGTDSASR